MQTRTLFLITLMGLTLALAGCRTAPIYNVDSSPVGSSSKKVTQATVGKAIKSAGAGLGWQMNEKKPGLIIGTLHIRSHMARVKITYDKRKYSIEYMDSANLRYDGESIHSNYNGWVQRLDNNIRSQLALM